VTLQILTYAIGTQANIWLTLALDISEDALISWV